MKVIFITQQDIDKFYSGVWIFYDDLQPLCQMAATWSSFL